MNTLINVAELSALISNQDVLVFDCRFSLMDCNAGLKSYQKGHIPGAFYVDLNKNLSSPHIPGSTGRHPLPNQSAWVEQVQQWGISPEQQVILYDDAGGMMASRMWWMLRWVGHENVAVLNGGWQAWSKDGPISVETPASRELSDFDYSKLSSLTQAIDVAAIDSSAQCLVDARELPRFFGEVEPIDPVAGHIPGAICSPFSQNLAEDGLFKSPELLRAKFEKVSSANKPIVSYCGSGVTAAHNVLSMKIAGIEDVTLYVGSWSEWITDTKRPIAKG